MALPPPPDRQKIGDATLGWGLIGASQIAARQMLPAIRSQPPAPGDDRDTTGAWAVGIFSHDESRARVFAATHQIPHAFVNLADLLTHPAIDCVYVGGHARRHVHTTLAALGADKHVLCETPFALSVADAARMQQVATERGLLLGVNFVRRADPALAKVRDLLAAQTIGDLVGARLVNTGLLPTRLQTWRLQRAGGGVIWDRTLHSIDLLRYLLRDEVDTVLATETGRVLGHEVEEDVVTLVRMARSGLTVQLHDSFILPHQTTLAEFYGSNGLLAVYDCFTDETDSSLQLTRNGVSTTVNIEYDRPYRLMAHRFLEAMRHGTPLLASGRDAIVGLHVESALRNSLPYRRAVKVRYPTVN